MHAKVRRAAQKWELLLFLSCASTAIQAAAPPSEPSQVPPDAGQILRQQQQSAPHRFDRLPQDTTNAPKPALANTGDAKVLVHAVHFTGAEGLATEAELQAQVKDALGQELGFTGLQQLAERVTKHLNSRGWFLARAYLPQQDVTAGEIEIAILRGRIEGGAKGEGIQIDAPATRLSETQVRNTLTQALGSGGADALRSDNLERGLLLLDDLPGIIARASLDRGDTLDTTRVNVHLTEAPLVSGLVSTDSYGNRFTGSGRVGGQAALNDPLGIGDQVTLDGSAADRLLLGRVGYSLPVGFSGLRAATSYTALRYRVGEELSDLDAKGVAQTVNAGLKFPFLRSRTLNIWGGVDYDHKALKDEALGLVAHDKRIEDVTFTLQANSFDGLFGGGLTNVLLSGTYGTLDLSRVAIDEEADAQTAHTQGGFTRYNYGLTRLQRLTDRLSLFASWNGQWANRNLDSAEQFMLGGPVGVRVYPVGEASGSEGWLTSAELRYDVPNVPLGHLQLLTFLDTGRIQLEKNTWGSPANAGTINGYRLTGTGLGVNYSGSRYAVRAAWATQLGSNPGRSLQGQNVDGRHNGSRFWLQALYFF